MTKTKCLRLVLCILLSLKKKNILYIWYKINQRLLTYEVSHLVGDGARRSDEGVVTLIILHLHLKEPCSERKNDGMSDNKLKPEASISSTHAHVGENPNNSLRSANPSYTEIRHHFPLSRIWNPTGPAGQTMWGMKRLKTEAQQKAAVHSFWVIDESLYDSSTRPDNLTQAHISSVHSHRNIHTICTFI